MIMGCKMNIWLKEISVDDGPELGSIVADELSRIAYEELGIEEVVYTSKNENIQSQKSIEKLGGTLVGIRDGYHFYTINLQKN